MSNSIFICKTVLTFQATNLGGSWEMLLAHYLPSATTKMLAMRKTSQPF